MIKGMTGFGSAQISVGKIKAMIEIKSVNHRYLDIVYYLPIGFSSIEGKMKQIIQKETERGRITVSIKILQKPLQTATLNKDIVRQYLKYANVLRKEFHLKSDMSLSDIITLPGVLESKETFVTPAELWPAIEKGLMRSLRSLVQMRRREGRALAQDVADKLKRMLLQIKKIQQRTKGILKQQKKNMTTEEFKSFQKSSCVNEEISRLSHYIEEMKKLLHTKAAVGKKVDFIAQEMQRETNTIGSKVQDKHVSDAVIALKSKIEKIREQSQNVE